MNNNKVLGFQTNLIITQKLNPLMIIISIPINIDTVFYAIKLLTITRANEM